MLRRTVSKWATVGTAEAAAGGGGGGGGRNGSRRPEPATSASLPTVEQYRKMLNEELDAMILKREDQIAELRKVYENFHYEVEKRLRAQVLDYQDTSLSLSKVHGQMQLKSMSSNREALVQMRLSQEMHERDKRACYWVSIASTLLMWFYCRRHYVHLKNSSDYSSTSPISQDPSTTMFIKHLPNARNRMTGFEKELVERDAKAQTEQDQEKTTTEIEVSKGTKTTTAVSEKSGSE